jgi:glycosyltransferase involved in cell wall biosynthesis
VSLKTQFKKKTGNLKALLMYPYIQWKLKQKRDLFFFFPFWQIGGGERVHADILKVFHKEDTLCFVTDQSIDPGFKNEFRKYADTIVLGRWSKKISFTEHMLRVVATAINKQKAPAVFGCHSHFFYQLIPYLGQQVKVIDLIHAFTFDPNGPEIYSLPHVQRLDHRVILGEKTKNDFRKLYLQQGIDPIYLERFVIIPNKTELPLEKPAKNYSGNLRILFIGRNAPEKRPEIFVQIAKRCLDENIPADFIMVGAFHGLQDKVGRNVSIIGELFDKKALEEIYQSVHLIVVTSWREGFPLVIMEGMGHGVVPITTNVGEIPYHISPSSDKNGFLIDNDQSTEDIVADFVQQIDHLCHNKSLLQHFGCNAYDFAKANFGEEKFYQSYRQLLLEASHLK